MDRFFHIRWEKKDIPKLLKIKKDDELVEKLKKENNWCDPEQYELLLKCSFEEDPEEWNSFRKKNPAEEIWLQNANLSKSHLENTDLKVAHLEKADLWRAHLENTDLRYAHFEIANLLEAHLENTASNHACFENSNMPNAHLENTVLFSANLDNANLRYTHLTSAELDYSKLQGTDFSGSDIRGSSFNYAELGSIGFYTYKESLNDEKSKLSHFPHDSTNFADVIYNAKNHIIWWRFWVLIWFIACKILHIKKYTKPKKEHFKQTTFIGVDTTNVDWSKNPQLKRDIHNQQYLQDLKSKFGKNPIYWFLYYLWGITSDFGNSMFRWIVTSVAIALIFGAIYSGYIDTTRFFEQPELIYTHDDNKPPPDKLTCYYYSVVTFTTLGFGDVVPVNDSGRIAVMIEVILGYIMLGGLISLFANKFVRRE